jgi:iron complex transport system substrate-binding protein
MAVAGCSSPQPQGPVGANEQGRAPLRVVSLDFCADQFVIKLADRGTIVAVSPDATRDFSFMRAEAKGLDQVRPDAETILALKPDVVVRSYGGGPQMVPFLERAGIKVHQIGWGEDFAAVRTNVRAAAEALGQPARGEAVVADFDRRLKGLKPAPQVSALYVTPGGVTTGPGSLVDRMMSQAGLVNFQTQKGWNPLPLERLATERPAMVVTAFFTAQSPHQDYWSQARHPLVRQMLTDLPVARLDGGATACSGWFMVDAMEAMAATGRSVSAETGPLPQDLQP